MTIKTAIEMREAAAEKARGFPDITASGMPNFIALAIEALPVASPPSDDARKLALAVEALRECACDCTGACDVDCDFDPMRCHHRKAQIALAAIEGKEPQS